MITAGDFRNGITFEINGEPHVVISFQHVKPGKGAAFVRTKYRNILTGATREEAFNPSDKFEQAHIDRKKMTYSYNDGELYYFMDPDTFDMVPFTQDIVEDAIKYINDPEHQKEKILVTCYDPQNALKLCNAIPDIPEVNAACMRYSEGKKQIEKKVFVDQKDIEDLIEIEKMGKKVFQQSVPADSPMSLATMIKKAQ